MFKIFIKSIIYFGFTSAILFASIVWSPDLYQILTCVAILLAFNFFALKDVNFKEVTTQKVVTVLSGLVVYMVILYIVSKGAFY